MRMILAASAFLVALATLSPSNVAALSPVSGSTGDVIGGGIISNVIDGAIDVDSWLAMGPLSTGSPFQGPYTVSFDLGGSFSLTGMTLWNNGGSIESDGEGINDFKLNFRDSASNLVGSFSGNATDTLAPQGFVFAAANVARVDLVILSNHESGNRTYALFHEIAFDGSSVAVGAPAMDLAGLGLLVLSLAGGAAITLRRRHSRSA